MTSSNRSLSFHIRCSAAAAAEASDTRTSVNDYIKQRQRITG